MTTMRDRFMEFFARMAPFSEADYEKFGLPVSRKVGDMPSSIKTNSESPRRLRKKSNEKDSQAVIMNIDWVFQVLLPILQKGEMDFFLADLILSAAHEKFSNEGLLLDLDFTDAAEEIETIVVGDIHGQFKDLLQIFEKFGRPSAHIRYVFNGDIVDRGPRSIACWLLLCALKMAVPEFLFITRGNHESRTINLLTSSFARECSLQYPQSFYVKSQHVFDELPVAYTINKSIFVTHGGLPEDLCLKKLRNTPKNPLNPDFDFETVMALMWNDPSMLAGYGTNVRGPRTHTFGHDITDKFLKRHNLSLLIRSHEYQIFGHQYTHQSKCLTIFSCPDYQNLGNSGAVARIDFAGRVKIEQFY